MANNDFFEYRHFRIDQRHAGMKVGTDSDLLGALALGGRRILDIGTGTGVLSLIMAQRFPEARITAIEIDENAIIDAKANFEASPYADRIELVHTSFQEFVAPQPPKGAAIQNESHGVPGSCTPPSGGRGTFDCIICNPPYFENSLENRDLGRKRARHTSSLPFSTLIEGAYSLLEDGGVFSVCIPPEVFSEFTSLCIIEGFWLSHIYRIKSVPEKDTKRYVLVHRKARVFDKVDETYCMRNSDKSVSGWYRELMKDFHQL